MAYKERQYAEFDATNESFTGFLRQGSMWSELQERKMNFAVVYWTGFIEENCLTATQVS